MTLTDLMDDAIRDTNDGLIAAQFFATEARNQIRKGNTAAAEQMLDLQARVLIGLLFEHLCGVVRITLAPPAAPDKNGSGT